MSRDSRAQGRSEPAWIWILSPTYAQRLCQHRPYVYSSLERAPRRNAEPTFDWAGHDTRRFASWATCCSPCLAHAGTESMNMPQ